jgi:acrylyl-CoA reductase (NADPH)
MHGRLRPCAIWTTARCLWQRIAEVLPMDRLDAMTMPATLADLPALGHAILNGDVLGRVVVTVNA